jgi:hypothetical protein
MPNNEKINEPFVLTVTDINNKKYYVQCCGLEHTNEYIKFALSVDYGFSMKNILLLFKNQELDDHRTFYQSGVDESSNIRLLIKLKSGFTI